MSYAELELTLRAPALEQVVAELQFRPPESAEWARLAHDVPIALDPLALLVLTHDPVAYGGALTAQLFAAAPLREAWARIRGFIEGANTTLRLRLRIDSGADALHALRWELLQDPLTGKSLCQSQGILFARYLDTDNLSRLIAPPRAELRALVVIANPLDLKDFNLAPVDVVGEVARTRAALRDLSLTFLAAAPVGPGATLAAIFDALDLGHSILYLVCHGALVEEQPVLWLEGADGKGERVSGEVLALRIADLPSERRPVLVVLATCQSAGRDDAGAVLAALGPRLARAGVGAVVGMQGNVSMVIVEQLMPRFFRLLYEDGQIDRALALARANLPDNWWLPVLYMRVRDGRLWAPLDPPLDPMPIVAGGLDALLELLRAPVVRETVAAFRDNFTTARAQVADVIALKDVHDLLHTLQFLYIPLTREARTFPDDEVAMDNITDYALTLRTRTAEIHAVFDRAPEVLGDRAWVGDLEIAYTTLRQALSERDLRVLQKALWHINRVLAVQPSYINTNLLTRTRMLRLRSLASAMEELHDKLTTVAQDKVRLVRFKHGVLALVELRSNIEQLVANHDAWQAIDREVRRIAPNLRYDTSELEQSWPDLRARLASLAVGDAEWAQALREEVAKLDAALVGSSGQRPGAIFQHCNRIIDERFYQVDVDLKRLCSHLRELDDPLAELERMLM